MSRIKLSGPWMLLVALAAGTPACGGDEGDTESQSCVEGQSLGCTCTDGRQGSQVCQGGAFQPCMCTATGAPSSGGGTPTATATSTPTAAPTSTAPSGTNNLDSIQCQGCTELSCPNEMQTCRGTTGCMELVDCIRTSSCGVQDYACLFQACSGSGDLNNLQPAGDVANCINNSCANMCG